MQRDAVGPMQPRVMMPDEPFWRLLCSAAGKKGDKTNNSNILTSEQYCKPRERKK
jgi:hypothetical protein